MSTGGPTRWSLSRSELARVSPARAGPHAAPPHVRRGCSGPEGVRSEIAILQTPDGHARLELSKFHTPSTQAGNRHAPANTPGIRHVAFVVEDIDAVVAGLRARGAELVGELERYEDSYRLCYVRGPEGIIIELTS